MTANDTLVIQNLKKIVEFENKVQSEDLNHASFKFLSDKHGQILKGNKNFEIKINRPFIHNIGSRIWPNDSVIKNLVEKWDSTNKLDLEEKINSVLKNNEYQIRYFNKGNINVIYGIVTNNFINVNPLYFREELINEIRKCKFIKENSVKTDFTKFGEVTELFNFIQEDNKEIDLSIGIIYGLNSGYSSYRLFWERKIVKCENALTDEMSKVNWKHTKQIQLSDFITKIINETVGYNDFLINRMNLAKNLDLSNVLLKELMERFHASKIVKDRIKQKYEDELIREGENEFALSQAFTNVGTHFYKASND